MGIKKLLGHKYLFLLVILSTSIITWASLAKFVNPVGFNVKGSDKIAHCIAYFVFALVWFVFFFFSNNGKTSFIQSIVRTFIVCFFYGVLMESLQFLLTSYRSFEWFDVLANTSGIIFAVLFLKVLENKLVSFKKNQ
ncbi:VanZ family protein [Aquimarina mytili]|uniref:VanZ family protein n=1 Tax=Aquimarina mytili TaxID=874423 RepID=A0A936ZWS0_9FLAO|nr:VanZ family protein [Aquimarina mytili]MBL0683676.1 VanZ family protein [Aquimarina mytili]